MYITIRTAALVCIMCPGDEGVNNRELNQNTRVGCVTLTVLSIFFLSFLSEVESAVSVSQCNQDTY
jgi:hypothetical protein